MSSFKSGTTDVLVATTVIEVGVDVPTATVMIIENAEKFGLSQLHQLRGRIGRSDRPSFCYLVVDDRSVSPEASQRINAMLETSDGFEIAERDLTIRGPGEMLGTKQAGDGQFRIADLRKDADILTIARQDTLRVVFG
jgi:ATP-dependent DNA helicase RecG